MFRHDRDSFGGDLCMYVNESIPVNQLNSGKNDRVENKNIFTFKNIYKARARKISIITITLY